MASSTEVHPNWLGHGQSKTIEGWFSAILHDADLDCFGGYPGEADWFDEVIVVNDPGLESGKYAHPRYFDRRVVEEMFRKYAPLDPNLIGNPDEEEDTRLEIMWDAEVQADQVNVTLRPPTSQEA